MLNVLAHYREYLPCEALREQVRCFFSFGPAERAPVCRRLVREVLFSAGDPFCTPAFADGHVSFVFTFPEAYRSDGVWHATVAGAAEVIGPMNCVGRSSPGERREAVGAYFRAGQVSTFAKVAGYELADRVVGLEEIWGAAAADLATELGGLTSAAQRIDRLEVELLDRMRRSRRLVSPASVPRLAAWALRGAGRLTVKELAGAAGISRQHLARLFREWVGVSPKTYCRLARFQSALRFAGVCRSVDWACAASEMGYADQSHMIAEFRRFSSLTPEMLSRQRWFHPFIERARAQYPGH